MEEEIDLRAYVAILIRRWRLIAAWTLIPALVVFIMCSFLPKEYAASAIVAVSKPRYTLQFDPRIESVEAQVAIGAYLSLAVSDELIARVLQSSAGAPLIEGVNNPEELREVLEASSGGDPSLVILKVKDTDPERAAAVANVWPSCTWPMSTRSTVNLKRTGVSLKPSSSRPASA